MLAKEYRSPSNIALIARLSGKKKKKKRDNIIKSIYLRNFPSTANQIIRIERDSIFGLRHFLLLYLFKAHN